jgi:hypothetical protein
MPDATVNIGGDASGAIAAVAAAQGAIDGLHGKTVNVEVNVRQNGGGAGGLASDLGRAGDAADRAGRSARGMGDSVDRAGRSARGMGDHMGRAGDHMGRAADDAERMRTHMDAVNNIMGGGAAGAIQHAQGMRQLGNEAERVRGSIGGVGSESSRSLGAAGTGAIRAGEGMRQLGTGANSARQFMAGAGGAAQQMSRDLVPMSQGADGVYRSVSRMAGAGKDVEKFAGSMRTIDAVGKSIDGGGSGGGGGLGGLMNKLGGLPDVAMPSMMAMKGVGLAAGVSALGMGALSAAVAGVGLAGVAEDFAHNNQLMHAGSEAVRGFNREFSAMKGATSAAGSAPMAGVAASMKGVGHELAAIGAANIAPALNDAATLGNQATQAMQKLAPSIGPAMQGLTALGGAVLGAFGDSGPAVTSFANTVTQNAAGLQSLMSGVISTAGAIGNATVATAANLPGGMDNAAGGSAAADWTNKAAGWVADQGRSIFGGKSVSPLSGMPAGHDMMGNPTTPAAPAAAAPVAPGAFDPSKPFSGMLADGKGGFTTGTGDGGAARPGRSGGGGYTPSPDANRFSGMAAGDVLTQQRADVGLPPVGAPHYSGVGPRGPGQSVGVMPASVAPSLGGGAIQPFNNMMQAAQSQVAGGGAATGAAMVQHVQKAVQVAAPAAQAGGAAMGAAMNTGSAQGMNSTQSVIDTVTIKHSKHIIDIASAALGIHSPSTEFDYLGRMTWAGFGQGSEKAASGAFGSMAGSMGGVLSAAQNQARKTSMDYDGSSGETVTVKRPAQPGEDPAQARQQAMQYGPQAMARIQAHNDRAGQLAAGREGLQRQAIGGMTHDERRDQIMQNRANNHERALANLHISGHAKPSGDVNPFAGDQHQSLWNTITRQGPIGDLRAQFNKAGQNSAEGLTQGMTAHVSKVQSAGAAIAGAGHAGYRKKDKQSSPSAVWADMAGNSAAGAVGGMNAGAPAMAAAGAAAAGTMADVVGGYLSDRGLMAGYTYGTNLTTGVASEIKKADYQTLGLPQLNQTAMAGLAKTRLLSAGSGAQSYKTPGNAPGLVTLPAAGGTQTLKIDHTIDISGQVVQLVTDVTMDMFGRVTDAGSTRAS